MESLFFFKQKTAYEMRISDWRFRRVLFRSLRGVALYPAIDRRMVDRNAAFRQHFPKVAIADRIATIPAHRPQDHITLEMAPLEIRHRSVRPISAKHAQASRFLQQSPSAASVRSEEHTSELQSLMRTSYAVFCLTKQSKKCVIPPYNQITMLREHNTAVTILTRRTFAYHHDTSM